LERSRLSLALVGCLALSLSLAMGFNLAGSHTCPFGLGLLVPAWLFSKAIAFGCWLFDSHCIGWWRRVLG
jgi:hypothetical protein